MREKNSRSEWSGSGDVMRVPCFDFSSWLRTLPEPPIVKLDVEGAEFPILERMVETGADALVTELLVEWHDDKMADFLDRRAILLAQLRCPVASWEDAKTNIRSTIRGFWRGKRALGAR
jgi:hypothetical protein